MRIDALASPEQDVVLGVWDVVLTTSAEELGAPIDSMAPAITLPYLASARQRHAGYEEWLTARVPNTTCEVWPDHGHYPHLVDPDRFVARIESFDATL